MEFDYRNMAYEIGEAWNAMKISARGKALVGKGNNPVERNIYIEKIRTDGDTFVDKDVSILIDDSTSRRPATYFLGIFEKGINELYPPNAPYFLHRLTSLTFAKTGDFLIDVTVGNDKEFYAFVNGRAYDFPFIEAMEDWTIMCQGDYKEVIKCAMFGTVRGDRVIDPIHMQLRGTAEHVNLFENRALPSIMLFQTSGRTIEDIVQIGDKWKNIINDFTYNEKEYRVDQQNSDQIAIRPNACFRYKLDLDRTNYGETYNGKRMLVMMCPQNDRYIFHLLDIGMVRLADIPRLIVVANVPSSFLGTFGSQTVELRSVEVGGYDSFEINIKPRILEGHGELQFAQMFSYILIRENEIHIAIHNNVVHSMSGNGNVKFLGAEATFRILSEGNMPSIEYTEITIENNHFLMSELHTPGDIILEELENNGDVYSFKTTFDTLKMITLINLMLNAVRLDSTHLM